MMGGAYLVSLFLQDAKVGDQEEEASGHKSGGS